ncbi:unnamed protein product [Phaeothamnion confervicola]
MMRRRPTLLLSALCGCFLSLVQPFTLGLAPSRRLARLHVAKGGSTPEGTPTAAGTRRPAEAALNAAQAHSHMSFFGAGWDPTGFASNAAQLHQIEMVDLLERPSGPRMPDPRQNYTVNVGHAIEALRNDIPLIFEEAPTMDIFSPDIVLKVQRRGRGWLVILFICLTATLLFSCFASVCGALFVASVVLPSKSRLSALN